MGKKICKICGEDFSHKLNNKDYCSLKCRGIARRKKRIKVKCAGCGKEFEKTEKSTRKYCNQKCYANRPQKEKITLTCAECGESFIADRNSCKRYNTFCCRECSLISLFRKRYGKTIKKGEFNSVKLEGYY